MDQTGAQLSLATNHSWMCLSGNYGSTTFSFCCEDIAVWIEFHSTWLSSYLRLPHIKRLYSQTRHSMISLSAKTKKYWVQVIVLHPNWQICKRFKYRSLRHRSLSSSTPVSHTRQLLIKSQTFRVQNFEIFFYIIIMNVQRLDSSPSIVKRTRQP